MRRRPQLCAQDFKCGKWEANILDLTKAYLARESGAPAAVLEMIGRCAKTIELLAIYKIDPREALTIAHLRISLGRPLHFRPTYHNTCNESTRIDTLQATVIPWRTSIYHTMAEPTLVVGIDDAPPVPMQIGNPEHGDFRGYEVSMLGEIARLLHVSLRYRRAVWSVIIGDLSNGDVDIVCSAATATPKRAMKVDFCRPHLQIELAVVTRENGTVGNPLDGAIGVRGGTTAEAYAEEHASGAIAKRSESNDELYDMLRQGRIDAVVDDSPIARYFSRTVPSLRFQGTLPGTQAHYTILVRKSNDALRQRLDGALEQLSEDGTLKRLESQWLG